MTDNDWYQLFAAYELCLELSDKTADFALPESECETMGEISEKLLDVLMNHAE